MSNLEQLSQPFPESDRIIVKLPQGTQISPNGRTVIDAMSASLLIPSKEFVEKIVTPIFQSVRPTEIFKQGTKVEILEPGKEWVIGNVRLRLVVEFVPDEPENNTHGKFVSPLDDIRNRNV